MLAKRPIFSNKQKSHQNEFIIIENDEVTSDEKEIAEKMNNFFIETIENLDIESFLCTDINNDKPDKTIDNIIKTYASHPSIMKIKEQPTLDEKISFTQTTQQEMQTAIKKLNPKKATVENDIPPKVLIETNEIVSIYLTKICNDSKTDQIFSTRQC